MKIKYYGQSSETGLTLTARIFDYNSQEIGTGYSMTETAVNSAIYISEEIGNETNPLTVGVYSCFVESPDGERRGFGEFVWNGVKEITLQEVDDRLWTQIEKMQLRDAAGVDGDKMVARNGQLQEKSEAPYNNSINTNDL